MSVEAASETCLFEHPAFLRLGEVAFRPAEADGAPVMILQLGKSSGALTLRSLQAELRVESGSADGRMFALVARALDFVPELRPGDRLPVEVIGGEASWQPSAAHQQVAEARLKLRMVGAAEGAGPDWAMAEPQAVLAAIDSPGMPVRLSTAYAAAMAELGAPDIATVHRLVEQAAKDLGFAEALRDRLLRRVLRMAGRVEALTPGLAQNLPAAEMVSRVLRLSGIATAKVRARFDAMDASMETLPAALAELDAHRVSVRQHRDWLYCSLRAWEATLSAWEAAGPLWTDATLPLLGRTYRFLAQRFMPVQEWQVGRGRRAEPVDKTRMVW